MGGWDTRYDRIAPVTSLEPICLAIKKNDETYRSGVDSTFDLQSVGSNARQQQSVRQSVSQSCRQAPMFNCL